ncbi:MAG: divergent polysaccharide deacetylase family protein [Holosporales bacterium]|jgi:polysaccharide deacetylase 2 family uncharacterized protein YibQ|nr:divergent polysaccharide deacetylase family protein [Holosporales bacterium]
MSFFRIFSLKTHKKWVLLVFCCIAGGVFGIQYGTLFYEAIASRLPKNYSFRLIVDTRAEDSDVTVSASDKEVPKDVYASSEASIPPESGSASLDGKVVSSAQTQAVLQIQEQTTLLKRLPLAEPVQQTQPAEIPSLSTSHPSTEMPAYKRYAEPCTVSEQCPKIALIVQPVGLLTEYFEQAIDTLPQAITFALSPYLPNLEYWREKIYKSHHEMLLIVPMEPLNALSNDTGSFTLLTEHPTQENLTLLRTVLEKTHGYVGVVNTEGSRFILSAQDLAPVLEELRTRGLYVLNCPETLRSVFPQVAQGKGIVWGQSAFFIDKELHSQSIDQALSDLEDLAKAQGTVIAVGSAYPLTLERLGIWIKELSSRGITLVPVTATITSVTAPQP